MKWALAEQMATALQDLIAKLQNIKYYQEMFTLFMETLRLHKQEFRMHWRSLSEVFSLLILNMMQEEPQAQMISSRLQILRHRKIRGKIYFWLLLFLMQQETVPVADWVVQPVMPLLNLILIRIPKTTELLVRSAEPESTLQIPKLQV
jgi:hypothetical protein